MVVLISKWGNSLAVRIPADVARTLSLKEGDQVDLRALDDGALAIVTEKQRRDVALATMKQLARPLPPSYRFDREEANSR